MVEGLLTGYRGRFSPGVVVGWGWVVKDAGFKAIPIIPSDYQGQTYWPWTGWGAAGSAGFAGLSVSRKLPGSNTCSRVVDLRDRQDGGLLQAGGSGSASVILFGGSRGVVILSVLSCLQVAEVTVLFKSSRGVMVPPMSYCLWAAEVTAWVAEVTVFRGWYSGWSGYNFSEWGQLNNMPTGINNGPNQQRLA
jgi:hypothetical protein